MTAIAAFPPGSPGDFIMRLIGERFNADLKQNLVVDNHAGAGGNIAAELVARAAPDGYTLLTTVDTVVTVNPALYKSGNFKANASLTPVIYLADTAQTLVCNPSVPVKSVTELITYAKATPISYESGRFGIPGHLAAELFMSVTASDELVCRTRARRSHTGRSFQRRSVRLSGHASRDADAESGKLIALAVTSPKRSPIAPDVPTMAEAGAAEARRRSVKCCSSEWPRRRHWWRCSIPRCRGTCTG